MFSRIGRFVSHHPLATCVAWLAVAILGVIMALTPVTGQTLFDRVDTGAPTVEGSQSARVAEITNDESDRGPSVTLVVNGVAPGDVDADVVTAARDELTGMDHVVTVLDPFALTALGQTDAAGAFTAQNGQGFLVVVDLALSEDTAATDAAESAVAARLQALGDSVVAGQADATARVTSTQQLTQSIVAQVSSDLRVGELVALPLAVLVMILVFGGFLAAAMPLLGALASIGAGFGLMALYSTALTINVSVINVITVIGLGLSIDYGLMVVSRYREELAVALHRESVRTGSLPVVGDGSAVTAKSERAARRKNSRRDPVITEALINTLATAGRTITFSALIVALCIAGLLVFRPDLLRSIGLTSASVVLLAVAAALTLVPALLKLAGRRMAKPGLLSPEGRVGRLPGIRVVSRAVADRSHSAELADARGDTSGAFFVWLARRVQRHPWLVMLACVAVLGVLASPVAGVHLRNSGVELLPIDNPQRETVTLIAEQYPAMASAPITVIAETSLEQADVLADRIAGLDGVARVVAPTTVGPYASIGVFPDATDAGGPEAVAVVHEIRDLTADQPVWTGGQAAGQIDFNQALADRMWVAVGLVVAAALVLLFLLTGSVVLPIKAVLTNALSLFASLGVLTWAFQDGHLSGLLDFTSTGGIETVVMVLVVAFAFGLAMDYEVFLVARILEYHNAGLGDNEAVQRGLQHSGRVITSAAAILVVVFIGFVGGQLLVIKQVGFALAVAVLLDATLVRMLLVPATMTVLGKWNWWAPAPLKRLHARLGVLHG